MGCDQGRRRERRVTVHLHSSRATEPICGPDHVFHGREGVGGVMERDPIVSNQSSRTEIPVAPPASVRTLPADDVLQITALDVVDQARDDHEP